MKKIWIFFGISFLLVGILVYLQHRGIINWTIRLPAIPTLVQSPKNDEVNLVAAFMDIGQGDATLLKFPTGQTMLVDCGPDANILAALGRNLAWSTRTLDYLVITHPHADHYGGCLDVLARFKVGHILLTGFKEKPNSLLNNWHEAIKQEQIADGAVVETIQAPRQILLGSTTLNFLYPDHDLALDPYIPGEKAIDTNDSSIVFKVSYGTQDILLTGDMEAPLEHYLVTKDAKILSAEILKAGHHGSRSSSSAELLVAVKPQAVTISAGKGNSYGHPHQNILYRFNRIGATVWRTDVGGDILATISTSTFSIRYATDSNY